MCLCVSDCALQTKSRLEGLLGFVLGFVWNVFMCLRLRIADKVLTSVEFFFGYFCGFFFLVCLCSSG